jgi:hypothetical protein
LPAKTTTPKPSTARDKLAGLLKPLLPRGWAIVPYARNLDALSRTTVMLHATAIRPAPAAPQGAVEVDYVVSVITHLTEPTKASEALDENVLDLMHALDSADWLLIKEATPTEFQKQLAWDITITVITRKD